MKTNTNSNFKKFLLLWSGELVSVVGNGLTSFGLGIYVFEQTGKASAMAIVTLLAFLPGLLLSAPAGVLADRYDRRLLMMCGDGLSALGLIYILFCMLQGEAQLWQICVGVSISSIFSSLLEPAYKATISDLLSPEEYTKASGLVGVAGCAKYLFSPIIAGFLLASYDITLLLVIDIATFALTLLTTLVVRKDLTSRNCKSDTTFVSELKGGWHVITKHKGVKVLVFMGAMITLFIGVIQTLIAPMMLAFSDSATLGSVETISSLGMLLTSLIIGMKSIQKNYAKLLSASLFFSGIFMMIFGIRENILLICISGFLFFAMLPLAQSTLDYLIRSNIENEYQGRAWGLIGLISQLGYVIAYMFSGIGADYIGTSFGIGVGRGSGCCIILSGMLLAITALILLRLPSIRSLEATGGLYE